MRKLIERVRRFFFPPSDSPQWVRLMPFAFLGIVTALVIYGSVHAWAFTNSSEFCGTTCHTMPPEYSAYQRSPHARVQCVECHIGRDIVTTQFTRKAGDLRHVVLMLTKQYEFPIYSRAMRPARQSCETCHFPEKFSDDSMREISRYGLDEENSKKSTYLIMKTGGGVGREGLGKGIHWHVENEVYFLAEDPLQQEIPYVRVVDDDGKVTEYYDITSDITPEDVAGSTLEQMDCITCHNRITHAIPSPSEAVDQGLDKRLLPADLPFLKEKATELLSDTELSSEDAAEKIAGLESYYKENYPAIYLERKEEIQQVVVTLTDMYDTLVFAEQEIDWATHPNNLQHKDFPGCFRCHDGSHLTGDEQAIRLECNLCHAIPKVSDATELVTNIEILRGAEPPSHVHSSWITLHGNAIDTSCASCHVPKDDSVDYTELEGKPVSDGSFCGNSACHANEWQFAKFNVPALEPVVDRQLYLLLNTSPFLLDGVPRTYKSTFSAMFNSRCTFCHSGPSAEAGLDLSSYESMMKGSKNGAVIVPGDSAGSVLIQRQSANRAHFGQVLDDEREELIKWVDAGAPEG